MIEGITKELRAVRHAMVQADHMLEALKQESPPSFTVETMVRGHFASSSTYNQTEATELNHEISRVLCDHLPFALRQAKVKLRLRETALIGDLDQAVLDLKG